MNTRTQLQHNTESGIEIYSQIINPKSKRKFTPIMNGLWKLIWRIVKLTLILFFSISILGVIAYRFINPPVTWLMIIRGFQQKHEGKEWKIDKQWVDFDEISEQMKRAAVAAEDQKFLDHFGFDFKAMEHAIDKNAHSHKLMGGSTISQQTAKNVFLWPGRTWTRKGLEAYFTVLIEIFWSKKRIMEVYLNEIEMGDGIYGVEAAAEHYYHKHASQLDQHEAAAIASIFPDPLKWSPTNPDDKRAHKQYLIRKNMRRLGPLDF